MVVDWGGERAAAEFLEQVHDTETILAGLRYETMPVEVSERIEAAVSGQHRDGGPGVVRKLLQSPPGEVEDRGGHGRRSAPEIPG